MDLGGIMDFYEMLESRDLVSLLHKVEYQPINFHNQGKVNAYLDDMRSHPEASVLIYGDYDLDGAMFIKSTESAIKKMGMTHVDVFRYRKRTHELDREAIRYCIQKKYEFFIVGDTASSDYGTLKMLKSYGIKVLVIDHHVTTYDYEDFDNIDVRIVNTVLENNIVAREIYKFSAGALAFCVFDTYFHLRNLTPLKEEVAYAVVSLYGDCMDMSNIFNQSLYYKAISLQRNELPKYILHFMNEYQCLSARFIGFWLAPRINALFRSENFDVLNKYLFDDSTAINKIDLIESINSIYEQNRNMVKLLSDLVNVEEMEHFVICNLRTASEKSNVPFSNLQNYTGLVANKLSTRYGKTTVVYCSYQNTYKGSVRDPYSRNYLPIFQQLCYAGGHGPAFGLVIRPFEITAFLKRLLVIDQHFHIEAIGNEPIIIDYNYSEPDDGLIYDIALYNEFSGSFLPVVYLRKQFIGRMKYNKTDWGCSYSWGEYYIHSDYPIEFGKFMLIKPIWGNKIKLKAQI